MKTFGAGVFCATCNAQPYPDDPTTTRETFDLVRIGDDWFCERHRPPTPKRVPRVTGDATLDQFERRFADLTARFETAIAFDMDENNRADLYGAFAAYRDEIRRSLTEVRKALAARDLPPDQDVGKPKRTARKRITSTERHHEKQGELLATSLVANTEDDAS
jgi:hypothetical protein